MAWRFALVPLLCVACPGRESDLVIFAAASTQPVVDGWIAEHPDLRAEVSYAASSTLAQQLLAGAPADVFVSADEGWTNAVAAVRPGGKPTVLARNALVVAVPQDAPLPATELSWMARCPGRIATGDPEHVPLGRYARRVLEARGEWAALLPRLVGAQDARAALALVEEGHVECAILYASDVSSSGRVREVARLDAAAMPPIQIVGIALGLGVPEKQTSVQFLGDLSGEPARFTRLGFLPP